MSSAPSRSRNGQSLADFSRIESAGDACIRFDRMFGSRSKKLKNDELVQEHMQHLRESHLFKEYDFGSDPAQTQTVVCEHTAQLKGCRVWIDKDDERDLMFISETDAAAQEFEKRGFTEYTKHSISDVCMVPKKAARSSGLPIIDVLDRPAPSETKIPETLPSPRVGMTLAAFVVEQFEDRVIDIENDEVFSPIRLWTTEARKVAQKGKGGKLPSAFLSRLNCYYAVKKLYDGVDPKTITDNQRDLIRKARSNATDKEGKKDFWFDTCVEIYNNM